MRGRVRRGRRTVGGFKDGQVAAGGAEELRGEDVPKPGILSGDCVCRCSAVFLIAAATASAKAKRPRPLADPSDDGQRERVLSGSSPAAVMAWKWLWHECQRRRQTDGIAPR